MKQSPRRSLLPALGACILLLALASLQTTVPRSWPRRLASPSSALAPGAADFTFAVAADMRSYTGPGQYDTPQYFRGAMQALAPQGSPDFLITPGDIDPVPSTYWTITDTLGSIFRWYPLAGNHELPGAGQESQPGANLAWLRDFDYGAVNPGPAGCPTTTYSFDYQTAHFVMLNQYCDSNGDDVTSGDVSDHLYNWLAQDLHATTRPYIFVFGHEPAYPQPDADNGRLRHLGDSLDQYPANRDRFWRLLGERRITAYICGHTHNYSAVQIDGVWQVDTGHARGLGDSGARSTFLLVSISTNGAFLQVFRDDASGGTYTLMHVETLWAFESPHYFPLVIKP